MSVKIFSRLLAALLLSGACVTANALSLSLSPTSLTAMPGDTIAFDVFYDFSADPTIGGGFDVVFNDSVLTFSNWSFSCAECDPDFHREPDVSSGLLAGIGFGNFAGISGPGMLGTLTFLVNNSAPPGLTALTMADTNTVVGPFVSATTFAPQQVDYFGAEVEVVPIPAAAWLLLGGIGTLFGLRRRVA